MSKHEFDCADCGEHKVHVKWNDCGGIGYATVREDGIEKKVCYECCGKRDLADMRERGRAVLYLGERENKLVVTNWPGTMTLPIRCSRTGNHNIAGTRETVWFTGPDGCEWWGVCYGHNTQLCHCRRLKAV
jgi:hypothetical protein